MLAYTCSPYHIFQVATLDLAVKELPDSRWWIKSDGADVVSGLMESVQNEWNGNVDLGNGALQEQYAAYCERLQSIEDLSKCDTSFLGSYLQKFHSR